MSAKHDESQGFTYLFGGYLAPFDEAIISAMFDEATDYQEMEIARDMKETKILRRVCLVKTLLYPIEMVLTKFILGKEFLVERKNSQTLYWKFLRKKLTLNEFKENLMKLAREQVNG